jgi:formylglycine-generating enzyme required for sulfatase activity
MKNKGFGIWALATKLCIALLLFCSTPSSFSSAADPVRAGQVLKDCPICPENVVVPPGSFLMGSNAINQMRGSIPRPEGPERAVTISYAFSVGRYEVTNEEFANFVNATGHQPANQCGVGMDKPSVSDVTFRGPLFGRSPQPRDPVVCVSWNDARAYASWLSTMTGKRYRLLTEAEWEYAAKAGSKAKWPWGSNDELACEYENTFDLDSQAALPAGSQLSWEPLACHDGHGMISPVGSYKPNAFGLYDMLGNVWEWAQDCSMELYPATPLDGTAVEVSGRCELRAVRGGSWYTRQDRHRPTFRGRDPESKAGHHFGFRIARDVE